MGLPRDDGFFLPAEWAPHSRCWMAWPCREELWGEHLDAARDATAEFARTVARFEPVTVIANADDVAEASMRCGSGVGCTPMEIDDSWLRDSGPTFLIDGKGSVAGVDWRFNAWGEAYRPYDKDAAVAQALLQQLEVPRYEAPVVLEGGAIVGDGEGTVITTESVLLDPRRNPSMGRADLEAHLRDYLGAETVIWLGEGLEDDDTGGHADNLVAFARPGVVLALTSDDPDDGNYEALTDALQRLRKARDAKGRALEVVEIAQPKRAEPEDGRRLSRSYVNFYIANGGVLIPSFEDSRDDDAYDAIAKCFPDREAVRVPVQELVYGGGGLHCITQPQPTGEAGTPPEATD